MPLLRNFFSARASPPKEGNLKIDTDTGNAFHRCRWHRWRHASPVSLIPGSIYRQLRRCQWHRRCMSLPVSLTPLMHQLNISANIRKKSKSSLGLPTGARRSCLKKKNRGEKSGGTVPLNKPSNLCILELWDLRGEGIHQILKQCFLTVLHKPQLKPQCMSVRWLVWCSKTNWHLCIQSSILSNIIFLKST